MFTHISAPIEGLSLTYSVTQSILSQWHACRATFTYNRIYILYQQGIIANLFSSSKHLFSQWYVDRCDVYLQLYLIPALIEGLSLTYLVTQNILSQWYVESRLLKQSYLHPVPTKNNLFSNSKHFVQFVQERALIQKL